MLSPAQEEVAGALSGKGLNESLNLALPCGERDRALLGFDLKEALRANNLEKGAIHPDDRPAEDVDAYGSEHPVRNDALIGCAPGCVVCR
jgi:hypothetical protein